VAHSRKAHQTGGQKRRSSVGSVKGKEGKEKAALGESKKREEGEMRRHEVSGPEHLCFIFKSSRCLRVK
jgi:hypothetical protein